MENEALKEKIEQILEPLLEDVSAELFELHIKGEGSTVSIEVLIDKVAGGISLGECSSVNRLLAEKLEGSSFMTKKFVAEVCSPGMDRDLKVKKDFTRILGREIDIQLKEPIEEKSNYCGCIKEVTDSHVVIKGKASSINIPLKKIIIAREII